MRMELAREGKPGNKNKQAIKQRMDNGWDWRFYSLATPISTDFLSQPFPE